MGVDVVNGVVHLNGVVDSLSDKLRAAELAHKVDGVVDVVNQLQIKGIGAASPR